MQVFKSVIEKQETAKEFSQYTFPAFHALKTENNIFQNNFGHIENMQELKLSLSETIRNPDVSVLMLLENPMVSFAIDTGVPDENGENTHLYDLAVIDGNKIWVDGSGKLLQLFDLHGNLH